METTGFKLKVVYQYLVVLALTIAFLVLSKDILMPMAFAALFSVVLLPVVKAFGKKMGEIAAISLTLFCVLILMLMIGWFVISQLSSLAASLPDLEQKFLDLITQISDSLNSKFKVSTTEQVQYLKDGLKNLSSYLGSILLSTSYLAYFFVQVPIYIFLFLLYRNRFKEFLLAIKPGSDLKWKDEIQSIVRAYISGLTLVVLIAGVLNSIGLLVLGIDHAIFFGFLSGALTMIPYVGITLGAALPTLVALITKDNIWYAVGVVAVHGVVQFLEGNFITPKITGSKISINALAAIVALLVGGKIWGIAGMILAVPAVGVLKILVSHSNNLKSFSILLGDEENTSTQQPLPPDAPSSNG
ncbi:MAG: AI-2E family transporter [Bacteroidota bacterium]|jgi:predicted PurR-regulated permease PerM|nr:AI-2E family transporter [Cytophagales bacterium]